MDWVFVGEKNAAGNSSRGITAVYAKKMKPLFIEKINWFHRLSFGARWNLRDMMRHKSRSAMSLIGIVGGMILIVGSLGMRDTMNAFLDLYYDGATNYISRIYFAEEATGAQREEILKSYNGDWSASVGVQIGEQAVSLYIYGTTQDKVRFPDKRNRYVELGDEGAYLCIRLAEQMDLAVGDSFEIKPYGTEERYDLTVAGIIRSVSESIVITSGYADTLGVSYTMDSVYTDTAKQDIALCPEIKSVQSKQMIMDSFDSFLEIMNEMILILVLGALVLSVVVLYNLGIMSYTERSLEMATLKVVGFQDKKIGRLLIGQNLWLSVLGILIGLPSGIWVLDYLLRALASEYEMKMAIHFISLLGSILLTLGMSLLVSLLVARKNRQIDMVEALKGTE